MQVRSLTSAALLLAAAGCDQPTVQMSNTTSTTNTTVVQTPAPAPAPTPGAGQSPGMNAGQSETLYRRYASCAATMTAMARFYRSLATQQGGAEQADSEQRAAARDAGAMAFRNMAVQLAASIGHGPAQVDAAVTQTEAEIRQASEQMPFEQFARTLAREADQCVQLGRAAGG